MTAHLTAAEDTIPAAWRAAGETVISALNIGPDKER